MSAQYPATFREWLQNLPLPWLVSGPNGAAWAAATGQIIDTYVGQMKDGVKARYPDTAPVDALAHIGGDRQLVQGASETNASFTTRLKDAWAQWGRAGTPCAVLEQLYYFGMTNAVWVQQNGLSYTLSGAPTPGQDPTSLVVASNTSATTSTLTSTAAPYRTIPAGTPWFAFDGNTDLTNRFAIIAPSWPFSALGVASFSNTDTATVTWPFTFADTTYSVIIGPPSDAVTLSGSGKTTTGMTINASAPWSGNAYIIAYASGVNPLNTFSSTSAGTLQRIIKTWRPNALCMGVFSALSGRQWGYPASVAWGTGNWGGSVSTILGAF